MSKKARYSFEEKTKLDPELLFKKYIAKTADHIKIIQEGDVSSSWKLENLRMMPQLAYERLLDIRPKEWLMRIETYDGMFPFSDLGLYEKYSDELEKAAAMVEYEMRYLTENYNIDTEHRYFYETNVLDPTIIPKPKKLNETGESMRKRGMENAQLRSQIIREAKMIIQSGGEPRSYYVTDKPAARSRLYAPLIRKYKNSNIRRWLDQAIEKWEL